MPTFERLDSKPLVEFDEQTNFPNVLRTGARSGVVLIDYAPNTGRFHRIEFGALLEVATKDNQTLVIAVHAEDQLSRKGYQKRIETR